MKYILIIFLLISSMAYGQTTYYISADSTRLRKVSGNNELIIENSTRSTTGLLTNYLNGRTRFMKPRISGDTLFIGVDSLLFPSSLSNNFANTNLTANGNRSHDWNGYDFIHDSIGQYVIRSNQTGTITGRYTTIGGKNLNLGVDINSFFDTDDFAKTQTNNTNGGSTVSLQVNAGSKYSEITNHPDSIYLGNTEGNISIDFIDAVSDTAAYKPLAWNPQTKRMVKHNYWPSGGGTPTLQQVLDAGSTLTSSETISVGANMLNLTGSGFVFYAEGGSIASQFRGTNKAALFDILSASTNTIDRPIALRSYTSGTTAAGYGTGIEFNGELSNGNLTTVGYFDLRFTDVGASTYTNEYDLKGSDNSSSETFMNIQKDLVRINNNADTLATKAYARSVGGSGSGDVTKVGTPVDNQIGVWTGDGTIEGDADLVFNGATNTFDVGASASGIIRVTGVTDGSAVGPLIAKTTGTGILGTALTLDVTSETSGQSWSFLNTGSTSSMGTGRFTFYTPNFGYVIGWNIQGETIITANGSTFTDFGAYRFQNPDNSYFGGETQHEVQLKVKDISAPSTPASGYGVFYVNTDAPWFKNDAGTAFEFLKTAAVNSVSPTAPDRTITVVIGGTTYYIHAKTTNN